MIKFIHVMLFILVILFMALLYLKLVGWSFRMKRYLRELGARQNKPQPPSEHKLVGEMAPEVTLRSIDGSKTYRLNHVTKGSDTILVFLDEQCIHCNNNFEEFFNEAAEHPAVKFIVIIEQSQVNKANEILYLYNKCFHIYLADLQAFREFQISFLPAFIYVDGRNIVQNVTPVPEFAFNPFVERRAI